MLEIKKLTKSFDEKILFKNFSYTFPDKGIYAITGESGIGKTTLLRIIAGLDKDFSGELIGGGIGRVSVAFQEYRLFPNLTALENIIYAISSTKSEADILNVKKTLLNLGFSEGDFSLYPGELSGGMKQRISIARAILKESEILLLDEPTKELDKANAEAVLRMIKDEASRRLVIFVSHNEEDILALNAVRINL